MGKRFWSIALSLALIGGVFSALPVGAQEAPAPVVPATPNIVDPPGDANFLNSGTAGPLGQDNTTPADASTIGDLLAVWFSHTADSISVHWQTEAVPPGGNGVGYQAFSTPGEGEAGSNSVGCLRFALNIPGSNPGGGSYQDTEWVRLVDRCNVGTSIYEHAIDGTHTIHEGPDGTGIMTATFPRSYSPLLAEGQVLVTPTAAANSPLIGSHSNGAYASPTTDNTKPGTDYVLSAVAGGSDKPSEPSEPPGKGDPPGKGKKKGCGKGKGQKKGACPGKKPGKPKPPAAGCAPYVPGEEGAEAETSLVTAAATEEKPVEVTITAPPGVPEVALGHVFQNIQVDAAAADAGLYVRYEFPVYEDHDIYLNYADGSEAAHAGGFNPAPVPVALGCCDGTGSGGHSEQGAEMLDGVRTADCAGYTLDMAAFASEGGEMTLKLWLGEVQNEPAAPGGGLSAADMMFGLLGIRNPVG